MNLLVISHKPCWPSPSSPSGYATDGGFPFQMCALSELFDRTTVAVPVNQVAAPTGSTSLVGHNLTVVPLDNPPGAGLRRKLSFLGWLPRNWPRLWRQARLADAVHVPLGSDVGTFGLFAALLLRKPLFIRYCGTWGSAKTPVERFWQWLSEKVANGRNVVLATGGGEHPPSPRNANVRWIFSTSMQEQEIQSLPERPPWKRGQPLRLITVARQEPGKNIDRLIRALAIVQQRYPQTLLHVVGDGSQLSANKQLAVELGLGEHVIFHGRLAHEGVISALLDADLFCFPTEGEGFPKAVHEAMACGLPVITTPVSVLPWLVGDRNGLMLQDTEPATIARTILEITANEATFSVRARNARMTALNYSLERWRDEIGAYLAAAWGELRKGAI